MLLDRVHEVSNFHATSLDVSLGIEVSQNLPFHEHLGYRRHEHVTGSRLGV